MSISAAKTKNKSERTEAPAVRAKSAAPITPPAKPTAKPSRVFADAVQMIHELLPSLEQITPHLPPRRTVWMEVTAYCPCTKCCGPNAVGLTASGKDVGYNAGRFVAADTKHLPFGTKLVIPGYHEAQPVEVIDRGGAIKGNKLDVFFPSHEDARHWGRRWVPVTVMQ